MQCRHSNGCRHVGRRWYPPSGPAASAAQTSATFRVSNNTSWVCSAVSKRVQQEAAVASPRQELRDYFDNPRVNCPDNTLDVFAWWRVSHVMLPSHSPLPMMLIPCLPLFSNTLSATQLSHVWLAIFLPFKAQPSSVSVPF